MIEQHLTLESLARELLEQQWEKTAPPGRRGDGSGRRARGEREQLPEGLPWLLHELFELVAESHDRPVSELAPMIRQRVAEQAFVDEWGTSVVSPDMEQRIDRQADLIVRVLEEVRQEGLRRGEWSETAAAPPMFG